MRLTLALSVLLAAAQQATAQYFIDYYAIGTTGCTGERRSCSNIPSGTCCTLNDWTAFYHSAKTGSVYGAPGFTVWTTTNTWGETCQRCRVTSGFGCWVNDNPFDTAFIVGLSPTCSAGVLRRATVDPSGNSTELVAGDEVLEGCTGYVVPDVLGLGGQDYAITDENRKEIEADFHGIIDGTRKFDFSGKWKSAHIGPTDESHQAQAGEVAKEKPASV